MEHCLSRWNRTISYHLGWIAFLSTVYHLFILLRFKKSPFVRTMFRVPLQSDELMTRRHFCIHFDATKYYLKRYKLSFIWLPFLVPLQPQDQILRLAAPFGDLEWPTGTPKWLGHGHQQRGAWLLHQVSALCLKKLRGSSLRSRCFRRFANLWLFQPRHCLHTVSICAFRILIFCSLHCCAHSAPAYSHSLSRSHTHPQYSSCSLPNAGEGFSERECVHAASVDDDDEEIHLHRGACFDLRVFKFLRGCRVTVLSA